MGVRCVPLVLRSFTSGVSSVSPPITTSGHDLYIYPNLTDTYTYLRLNGNGNFQAFSNPNFEFYNGATRMVNFSGDYGIHHLERAAAPTAIATYGCLWAKNDDTLHWIDGGGVDHTVTIV